MHPILNPIKIFLFWLISKKKHFNVSINSIHVKLDSIYFRICFNKFVDSKLILGDEGLDWLVLSQKLRPVSNEELYDSETRLLNGSIFHDNYDGGLLFEIIYAIPMIGG